MTIDVIGISQHPIKKDHYRNPMLNEREKSYGAYAQNAQISQTLKHFMRECPNYRELPAEMQESLEMIALKIARILNGNAQHKDSWADIAGYANLISENL